METSPSEPNAAEETMREHYDFPNMRGGVRGKHAERCRTQEPTVRIFRKDGTVEEGSLSEMRKKFGMAEPSPQTADEAQNFTLVAVPTELLPQVQALIGRGRK